MIKICIAGAAGNVGRELVKEIINSSEFILADGIANKNAGRNLGEVINIPQINLRLKSSVDEIESKNVDVLIDYTSAKSVKDNVRKAISKNINVVIGSSGLTEDDYIEINELAIQHKVGVFAAGNYSITSALMQHFAKIAAKYINHWEIIDYAPDSKPDAPSGTSRELSKELEKINKPEWNVSLDDTIGSKESRGVTLNNSQVHSIRVPGFYSSSEIIFGLDGEKLTLRHDSISYKPYVTGTLLAAKKVMNFIGLKRGISSILEF
jgi:4-hydroxy-tetrahydrodipicolinate reductase